MTALEALLRIQLVIASSVWDRRRIALDQAMNRLRLEVDSYARQDASGTTSPSDTES